MSDEHERGEAAQVAERVRREHVSGVVDPPLVLVRGPDLHRDRRFQIRRLAALTETAKSLGYALVPNVAAG